MNKSEKNGIQCKTKQKSGKLFSARAIDSNGLGITGTNIPIQSEEVNHLRVTVAFHKIKFEELVHLCEI